MAAEQVNDNWHREAATIDMLLNVFPRRWGMRVTVYGEADPTLNGDWYLAYNLVDTNKNNNDNWVKVSGPSGGAAPSGDPGEVQINEYPDGGAFAGGGIFVWNRGDLRLGDAASEGFRSIIVIEGGERGGLLLDATFIQTLNNMRYIGLLGGVEDLNGVGYISVGPRGATAPTDDPIDAFYLWSEGGVPIFKIGGGVNVILDGNFIRRDGNTQIESNVDISCDDNGPYNFSFGANTPLLAFSVNIDNGNYQSQMHFDQPMPETATVDTSNAVPTTLTIFSASSADSSCLVIAEILLRDKDTNDSASLIIAQTYHVDSDGISGSLDGAMQTIMPIAGAASLLAASVSTLFSLGGLEIRVTGINATNIRWTCKLRVTRDNPGT